jgi:hypothetical protein
MQKNDQAEQRYQNARDIAPIGRNQQGGKLRLIKERKAATD